MPNEKKKLLILSILDMLQKKTDRDHPMRYIPIMEELTQTYGLTATRKSVQHNINDLQEAGYPLVFFHGWYYEHDFDATELDKMVDAIALDVHLTADRKAKLMENIRQQGGQWYTPRIDWLLNHPVNDQTSQVLEKLCEQIREQRQVSFHYADYDVDGQLHPRKSDNGRSIQYKVNPFRLERIHDFYYLLANVDGSEGVAAFRLDRIQDIRQLKSPVAGLRKYLDESGQDADSLFVPPAVPRGDGRQRKYLLRVNRTLASEAIDWFGYPLQFEKVTDNGAQFGVKTEPSVIRAWLETYGAYTQLLRGVVPADLEEEEAE